MHMDVDISGLQRAAVTTVKQTQRAAARGISDVAFEVQKLTPRYMAWAIDNPTAFTVRNPIVDRANPSVAVPTGTIRLNATQASYLHYSEHGETDHKLIVPIGKKARDRHGNFNPKWLDKEFLKEKRMLVHRKKFRVLKRGKNKGKKTGKRTGTTAYVSRYFKGKPKWNPLLPAGIWERTKDNYSLRAVAIFKKQYKYRETFGIEKFWKDEVNARIKPAIEKRLARMKDN